MSYQHFTLKSSGQSCSQRSSFLSIMLLSSMGFPGGSEVKASACNAGDLGSIPGLGRSPGEGNGNPLQYSCLENPMEGRAWQAAVHRVAKSQTQLSYFTLATIVYTRQSQFPNSSHHSPFFLGIHVCSLCLCLYFCSMSKITYTGFSRFHIYALIYSICFTLITLNLKSTQPRLEVLL